MKIERVPATRGYAWMLEGLRLLGRQPIGLLAIGFMAVMMMFFPLIIPLIGVPLALAIVPVVYVGLMKAIRAVDQGQPPNPALLFSVFAKDGPRVWQPLLMLGAVSAVLAVAIMGVNALLGGATLADFITTTPEGEMPHPSSLIMPFLVTLLLYTPFQMAMWYSPMFVAWHQVPVGKSLFYSLVAVWRNRWAFVTLFIAWVVLFVLVLMIIGTVFSALALSPGIVNLLVVMLTMAAFTAMYCSFWVTYRDVIH